MNINIQEIAQKLVDDLEKETEANRQRIAGVALLYGRLRDALSEQEVEKTNGNEEEAGKSGE